MVAYAVSTTNTTVCMPLYASRFVLVWSKHLWCELGRVENNSPDCGVAYMI